MITHDTIPIFPQFKTDFNLKNSVHKIETRVRLKHEDGKWYTTYITDQGNDHDHLWGRILERVWLIVCFSVVDIDAEGFLFVDDEPPTPCKLWELCENQSDEIHRVLCDIHKFPESAKENTELKLRLK